MAGRDVNAPQYQSLRASRRALGLAAPVMQVGLFAAGLAVFLERVRPLLSDAQFTWGERRVAGIVALVTLGSFGLAGWAVGRLTRAASELIEIFVDSAEAAARTNQLIEAQVVPGLARAVAALERLANAAPRVGVGGSRLTAEVRAAIREADWGRAARQLEALQRHEPGHPELPALRSELGSASRSEVEELTRRLDEALDADDGLTAVDCRDALTRHLKGDALDTLDRRVVRRLASDVRRRARDRTVDADVAALAARLADSFADTPEGASVLAALPGLRRSAGLCPGCGRVPAGRGGACVGCDDAAVTRARPARPGRGASADGGHE